MNEAIVQRCSRCQTYAEYPLIWVEGATGRVVLCLDCSYLQYLAPDEFYTTGWKQPEEGSD